MRIQPIFVVSAIALVAVSACAVLVARKYKLIGVELTQNAEANRRVRELEAHATLQRLAANPKLTVVRQALSRDQGRSRKTEVLCVISRHIVPVLLKSADPSQPPNQPLLKQLESIDVEPVPYDKTELPALIAEIDAAQKRNPSPALADDFKELLGALENKTYSSSQVVFY
jgi:hypothetical protein